MNGGRVSRPAARNPRKKALRAHGAGGVTHNMATAPGELQVTVWGWADREPDRDVGVTLDEAGVQILLQHLRSYGLLS